jgi:hypothetical protein
MISSLGFGEVLFPFVIRLVDLSPWRNQKNDRRIPVLPACTLDQVYFRQADETSVAESILDATICERGL